MSRQFVSLALDDNGELWIDVAAPASIRREGDPAHRIALKVETDQLSSADVWLRMKPTVAGELVDRLSGELQTVGRARAHEVLTNLKFRRLLNGGVDPATGRLVLNFEGERGRYYRIELPGTQSGALINFVRLAAEKAAEKGNQAIARTAADALEDECAPVEAAVVSLKYDPVSKREILTARLPNSLEYYFALTERQARELRESAWPSKD